MLKYHIVQYMAMLSTKLVRIKQNQPANREKEKRQTRKPAAFELPEQKLKANPITMISISHIQHFFNAF